MRKSFIVHNDSLGVLDDLTDEQCGELFRAIKAHQLGESIDLSPIVKVAFSPFKNQFARDDEKYEKLCEKNRQIAINRHTKSTTGNHSQPPVTKSTDNDSKSKNDSKSDKDKTLDQSEIDRDRLFEVFWLSGIRKVNKKKTKSLFNNLLKRHAYPDGFTEMLIADVQSRLRTNQLGFAEMHPTTYLNGERWNDEVIPNAENNRPNQGGRPSAVDRVRIAGEKREAERQAREGDGSVMAETVGNIRSPTCQPVRGDDTGELGQTFDGHFTTADS